MKKFEIIATRENGTNITDYIYAANESAARGDFKEVYRNTKGLKIEEVTDLGGDFPANKAQEREALKQIREIVEMLGPDSYVATAFDGVFGDAESNIEQDATFSMKDRWLTSEKKVTELQEQMKQLSHEKTMAIAEASAIETEYKSRLETEQKTVAAYEQRVGELEEKVMSDDDRYDLYRLVCEKLDELDRLLKEAETAIIENAEHPETEAFKDAVKQQRAYASSKAHYKELQKKVY